MIQSALSREPPANIRAGNLAGRLIVSLWSVILGSLVLRIAAQTMGQMLQFYFARISSEYHHLSHATTGLVTASFFVTELLGSPVLGALSDRRSRKLFIILGPLLGAIAVQITAFTIALWLLVVTRLFEGLSTATSIPATLGYISEVTTGRPGLRARIMGLFEITFVGGIAAGAILGGYLWKYFSRPVTFGRLTVISPAFAVDALVYLASMAVFAFGMMESPRADNPARGDQRSPFSPGASQPARDAVRHKFAHYLRLIKSPPVWDFVPAWLAVNSIIGMWINHSPRLLTGRDHFSRQALVGAYSPVRFGNGYAAFALIFAGGVFLWSLVIGRYRKTSVMLVAVGGLFLTLLSVLFMNHSIGFSRESWLVLTASMIAGVVILSGFTPAALTYLADVTEIHVEDRGSIMGLYTVFLGVGQVIGTAIGGFFAATAGIDGLILLSTIFGAVTLLTLMYLRGREFPAERS